MDYPTLIADKTNSGSIQSWVNYSLVPSAEIIKNAEDEIFARLRVQEMRKSIMVNLAIGSSTAPLPADFLDLSSFRNVTYQGQVKRVSDDRLLARRCYDGTGALIQSYPSVYGVFDELFQFDCAALAAITLNGMYYAVTHLGPTQTTSFLTTRYSSLFRSVLQKWAHSYRKDLEAAQGWAAQSEGFYTLIEQNDDLSYRGLDDDDWSDGRL